MRTFVAVEVPPLAGTHPSHLTLKFLGEIDPGLVPRLAPALASAVGGTPAFRLVLQGVGAFPSTERPRVVWAGVGEGRESVVALAAQVERAAVSVGLPLDDRPFSPHVTILRVRGSRDLPKAREVLASSADRSFGETVVREVVLVASELRREGAVHRPLERFPLRPGPDGLG